MWTLPSCRSWQSNCTSASMFRLQPPPHPPAPPPPPPHAPRKFSVAFLIVEPAHRLTARQNRLSRVHASGPRHKYCQWTDKQHSDPSCSWQAIRVQQVHVQAVSTTNTSRPVGDSSSDFGPPPLELTGGPSWGRKQHVHGHIQFGQRSPRGSCCSDWRHVFTWGFGFNPCGRRREHVDWHCGKCGDQRYRDRSGLTLWQVWRPISK